MSLAPSFRSGFASLVLAAAMGVTACSGGAPPYDYKREPDPRSKEYEIGPLDLVKVVVWKNPELTAEVAVRPDGIITLPLIGDVRAAGRSPSQIQKEINGRYAQYVRVEEANISVAVTQVNSYTFTVSGAVEKAGVYKEKNYVTALEAIALAGGPNRYASSTAYIVRGTPPRRIPIDMKRASSGEHPEENLVVLRGDLIVVQ